MTRCTGAWSQQPVWRRGLRWIGRGALRALTRLEMEGDELVPAGGPCVFAVNHRSLLDGALIGLLMPRPCAALVAEEWQRRAWVRACLAAFPSTIPLSRTGGGWQGLLRHGHGILLGRGTGDGCSSDGSASAS